jgi:hypothetical protein
VARVARTRLSAVAQTRGDTVDRQVNPGNDVVIRVTGAVTFQELDLHVVERVEIGEAVADRARQERVAFEQALLADDRQQCVDDAPPFRPQPGKDPVAQLRVGDQLGIARGDRDVALCQHHVYVRQQHLKEWLLAVLRLQPHRSAFRRIAYAAA